MWEININTDNIAEDLGIIDYKIVCMVFRRVYRIYYKERNVILQADSYLVKLKR